MSRPKKINLNCLLLKFQRENIPLNISDLFIVEFQLNFECSIRRVRQVFENLFAYSLYKKIPTYLSKGENSNIFCYNEGKKVFEFTQAPKNSVVYSDMLEFRCFQFPKHPLKRI